MLTARNTNHMMPVVYDHLHTLGITEHSRNGPVLAIPAPVTLCYTHPMEKVNFCPIRDANPFFHFFESLWMLNGQRDVATVAHFVKRMADYSDDGAVFNAAYGYRIRHAFGLDQLAEVIAHLKCEPQSRQAVIQIWAARDINKKTRDKACNMQLVFRIISGALDMTVFNRSNDAIWGGVSGANITNLPVFQEYIAAHLNLPVGRVFVVSNNLHIYLENPKTEPLLEAYVGRLPYPIRDDEYSLGDVQPYRLITNTTTFDEELAQFMEDLNRSITASFYGLEETTYHNPVFLEVAAPMFYAWTAHKRKKRTTALNWARQIQASDWQLACVNWLERRYAKPE